MDDYNFNELKDVLKHLKINAASSKICILAENDWNPDYIDPITFECTIEKIKAKSTCYREIEFESC